MMLLIIELVGSGRKNHDSSNTVRAKPLRLVLTKFESLELILLHLLISLVINGLANLPNYII